MILIAHLNLGPYIKWFLKSLGPFGCQRLLDSWNDKTATAICTFAYTSNESPDIVLFRGRTHGEIVYPRGVIEHLNWYCLFKPNDSYKTFSEMTSDQLKLISHRSRALSELKKYFKTG